MQGSRRLAWALLLVSSAAVRTGRAWEFEDALVPSDRCSCTSECTAFGDPHVMSMDHNNKIIECQGGSTAELLSAYGIAVNVICAGSSSAPNKGWIRVIDVSQDDEVKYSHDALECEELEQSQPNLQQKKNWIRVLHQYSLFNPDLEKTVKVTIACSKKKRINMEGTNGTQNTVFHVHMQLKDYSSESTSGKGFLIASNDNGVGGKCLPYSGPLDADTFSIKKVKKKQKKTLCSYSGLTWSKDSDTECRITSNCDTDDCRECYPDDAGDDVCHFCMKSTEAHYCTEDADCCSNSCSNGACAAETSMDQIPPACCDPTLACNKDPNSADTNAGRCQLCVEAEDTCTVNQTTGLDDCCGGLDCINGTCVPHQTIETCTCSASCSAVADPVVRGFAWYAKNIKNSVNTLYSDPSYSSGSGLEITYDTVASKKNGGLWITTVYVDGVEVFSLDDCPVYEKNDLPKCNKKTCNQIRYVPDNGEFFFPEAQQVMLNGIWPFETKNNLLLRVHCVSKRRIQTDWPDHKWTRLDVFVNKEVAFQKTVSSANEQNVLMYHELSVGTSGHCVEPFASDPTAVQDIGSESIQGWVKSNKIQPSNCTCITQGDDI